MEKCVNFLFKLLLSLNATSWMLVVYFIKEGTTMWKIPQAFFGLILLLIPIGLSLTTILISNFLGTDSIKDCQEFNLADNEFLPTYLGYFFVSLSISDNTTMLYLYVIVFGFTFISQTQYFNPIFLLFGYHYYHVCTKNEKRVFIIARGKVIRDKEDMYFDNLKRINDTTYIQRRKKK